jgi:hypothetical protein
VDRDPTSALPLPHRDTLHGKAKKVKWFCTGDASAGCLIVTAPMARVQKEIFHPIFPEEKNGMEKFPSERKMEREIS